MDKAYLENKMNKLIDVAETKRRKARNMRKKLHQIEKNIPPIQNTEEKISRLENLIADLKNTHSLTELTTFTYVKNKYDYPRPESFENDRKYYASLIHDKYSKECKDSNVAIPSIPMRHIERMLGTDLKPHIDKKIPIRIYYKGSTIVNVELIKEDDYNLFQKRSVSIIEKPEIKKWIDDTISTIIIPKIEKRKDAIKHLEEKNHSSSMENRRKEADSATKEYETACVEVGYLENCLKFNQSNLLNIMKKEIIGAIENPRGYVACLNNDTIAKWAEKNWYEFVFSTSKTQPMKTKMIKIDMFDFDNIKNVLEIKEGDYMALESRTRIIETGIIDTIYEKVRNGIKIFPYNSQNGIRIPRDDGRKTPPPQPRHWGQEYLGTISTGKIIEGEFFATGFTYQAFPIDKLVVIEANEENRATYILEGDKFDDLRLMNRGRIIEEKPEGYKGRVFHTENKQRWKDDLNEYLKTDGKIIAPKNKIQTYSFVVQK